MIEIFCHITFCARARSGDKKDAATAVWFPEGETLTIASLEFMVEWLQIDREEVILATHKLTFSL